MNKKHILTISFSIFIIAIISVLSLIIFVYPPQPKTTNYEYGEYIFNIFAPELASGVDFSNRAEIEAFICEGQDNIDKLRPTECYLQNLTETSFQLYKFNDIMLGDSHSEIQIVYSFEKYNDEYYVSQTKYLHKCAPGRGGNLYLHSGECS